MPVPATALPVLESGDRLTRRVIESETFPGLRLNLPKMLAGELAGVLAEIPQPGAD